MNLKDFEALSIEERETLLQKLEEVKVDVEEKVEPEKQSVKKTTQEDVNIEVDTSEVDKVKLTEERIKAIVAAENKKAALLAKISQNEYMSKALPSDFGTWEPETLEKAIGAMEKNYSMFKPAPETPKPKRSNEEIIEESHRKWEIERGYRKEVNK